MSGQLTEREYAEHALTRKLRQRSKLDAEIAGLTELVKGLRRSEADAVEPCGQADALLNGAKH